MKIYKTLSGEVFDLDFLPAQHREAYEEIKDYFDEQPHWNDFANFWLSKLKSIVNSSGEKLSETALFRVCQDLESRLGIQQGFIRRADYRDILRDIIEVEYTSRYHFCKVTGIDEGFLSNILSNKKDFSIAKFQEVLHKLGYELAVKKKEPV